MKTSKQQALIAGLVVIVLAAFFLGRMLGLHERAPSREEPAAETAERAALGAHPVQPEASR